MLAVFDHNSVVKSIKFATPRNYGQFLKLLDHNVKALDLGLKFAGVAIAAPGKIDRQKGVALDFGNLPWHNAPLKADGGLYAVPHGLVLVENDANLAGLSEAQLVKESYKKVLYLTISTGIGDGLIINGQIDPVFADSEPGQMILEHEGKLQKWEDFASGKALFKKYGKKASEIDDPKIWQEFVKGIALGVGELIATLTPEVIILGGGVGAHYDKFGGFLNKELREKYQSKLYELPPIIKARRPEEAVIYGCYELLRQTN